MHMNISAVAFISMHHPRGFSTRGRPFCREYTRSGQRKCNCMVSYKSGGAFVVFGLGGCRLEFILPSTLLHLCAAKVASRVAFTCMPPALALTPSLLLTQQPATSPHALSTSPWVICQSRTATLCCCQRRRCSAVPPAQAQSSSPPAQGLSPNSTCCDVMGVHDIWTDRHTDTCKHRHEQRSDTQT